MDEASDDGDAICPLCMEEMDMTDRQLKPCHCGYQICVWCWHHVMEMAEKDNSEGRCPACRTPYDKEKIVAATASGDRLSDFLNERKHRPNKAKSKAFDSRKNLSNVRVIQRNLVYIVGIPGNLADEETLERREYFGQYGKILKVSVSKISPHNSQQSNGGQSASVYVTYAKEEDAFRCIQAVNGCNLEGRSLKACFGTTKYCNAWLKKMHCNNPDCLYLHDEGIQEDSFTKEEIFGKCGSKHQHFHDLTHPAQRRSGIGLPSPITEATSVSFTSHPAVVMGTAAKPPLANGSPEKHTGLPAAASWGSRGMCAVRSVPVRTSVGVVPTKVRPGTILSSQSVSATHGHGVSAAMPPSSLATSAAVVAGAASASSSEPCRPSLVVLDNHTMASNGNVPSAGFIKQNNVKTHKRSSAETVCNVPLLGTTCGIMPGIFSDAFSTESRTDNSGGTLYMQASTSERKIQTSTCSEQLGLHENSVVSSCSLVETNHIGCLGTQKSTESLETSDISCVVDNFKPSDSSSTELVTASLESPSIARKSNLSERACALRSASAAADSSYILGTGIYEASSGNLTSQPLSSEVNGSDLVETCRPSCRKTSKENIVEIHSSSYRQLSPIQSLKSFSLVGSDRLDKDRLSSVSTSLTSSLDSHCRHSFHNVMNLERSMMTHEYRDVIGPDKMIENVVTESTHTTALNVGDLSIHLNADASSSVLIKSGKIDADFDGIMEDPWPQTSSPSSSLDCCESSRLLESVQLVTYTGEKSIPVEKPVEYIAAGKKDSTGGCAAAKEKGPESTGESELISDMLSIGFDIWEDGNPQDLANLLFGGRTSEAVSPFASKELLVPQKTQSTRQSRFHFARQEDLADDSSTVSARIPQNGSVLPLLIAEHVDDKQMPSSLLVHKNCSTLHVSEALSKKLPSVCGIDRVSTASDTSFSSILVEPVGKQTSLNSKSLFSAPPGFSVSARGTLGSPLGVSLQRSDYRISADKSFPVSAQASEAPSSTPIETSFQAVSSSNDVKFIDPAIMAVGRGKVPPDLNQIVSVVCSSSVSGFPSQSISNKSSFNPALGFISPQQPQQQQQQLLPRLSDANSNFLLQQRMFSGDVSSLACRNPLGLSNRHADFSLSSFFTTLNDSLDPSKLLGQYQDGLNQTPSQVGIQELSASSGSPQSRLSLGNGWGNWNRVNSSLDTSTAGHRLVIDGVGQTNNTQSLPDRTFQGRFTDLVVNNDITSNLFGEAVCFNGQNDQREYHNQRVNRYFTKH